MQSDNSMSLAIAFKAPLAPSETFIAAHIEKIAPGKTIGLAIGGNQVDLSGLPYVTLSPDRQHGSFIARKIEGAATLLRTGSKLSLSHKVEREALDLILSRGVGVMLAEYGPIGCSVRHLAKMAGLRFFVHFHGFDASMLLQSKRWINEYEKLFLDATAIIVPSDFLGTNLIEIGCPPSKIRIIPYGVDIQRFVPTARRDDRTFLAVGRMVEKKAPDLTLTAFARVAHHYEDANLIIVGDGYLMERCCDLAVKLGVRDKVSFLGMQSHDKVRQLMGRATVFVQHSVTAAYGDTEGLPVAILEAMASGLPVVATRHSGIPEAVEDGISGYLVEERDVDRMARAMLELAGDNEQARRMGAAGRARVMTNFSSDLRISQLRELLLGTGSQ